MTIWTRALAVWVLLMGLETIHGLLRQLFLAPVIGDLTARRLAVFTGMTLILTVALLTTRWIGRRTTAQSLSIGMMWVTLTLVFEVAIGLIVGATADRFADDYDPRRGGLMIIGILFLASVPMITARIRPNA